MGLDMYLYLAKREYKSEYDGGCTYPDEFAKFQVEIEKHNFKSMLVETKCQVGYWRKANAIHKWFVDKCSDGVDECQTIYVSKEKLQELLDTCKDVVVNPDKANELLPTSSGFFFGSTKYDDWYFEDLKYTIDLIEKIFDFIDNGEKDNQADYGVIYEASW